MLNRIFIKKHTISISVIIFIIIYSILYYIKPDFIYNQDGSLREFGIGYKSKTIIPLWLLSIIIAILSYFIVSYYIAIPKLKY